MANVKQHAFTGGEIAPALYARTDLQKYSNSLRTCRNFLVQKHGGITNRPGTEFIRRTKYTTTKRTRLLKFVFDAEQAYVLEFGDRYIRFIKARAAVPVDVLAAAWVTATAYAVGDLVQGDDGFGGIQFFYCTTAHTSGASTEPNIGASWATVWYAQHISAAAYEIPSPYLEADLPTLQITQSADIITIVHPSYAPRELARHADDRWILSVIEFGPQIDPPTNLALLGGSAGVDTFWAVTSISETNGEESLPAYISAPNVVPSSGAPTTVSWDPVVGAIQYRVYRSTDGNTYGFVGFVGGLPQAVPDTTWTTDTGSVTTTTTGAWVQAVNQARNPLSVSATSRAYDGMYRIRGRITYSSEFGQTTRARARAFYSRDGETRVDAGLITDDFEISGLAVGAAGIDRTINVPDNGYTTLTIDVVPEVFGVLGGGNHTASVDFTVAPEDYISWSQVTGSFEDVGNAVDPLMLAPTHPGLFNAVDEYPAAVGFYQQRRTFGNTNLRPELIRASRVGIYHNFGISTPLQDDDALSFSLAGRFVSAVRHLLDLGRLIVFTASGEWIIEGSDGILTPSSLNARQYSYNGVAKLAPVVISNTALYLQARGSVVRDLFFDSIEESFKGNDLSVYAMHLFEGHSIVDWDYQQIPHSIVWAVRDDGILLALTYLREHEVLAWHRHDTDGFVENVCVIPEGHEDAVYVVVRRTIEGVDYRYIEAFKPRRVPNIEDAFFVDSGLSYDGRNTSATTMTLAAVSGWTVDDTVTATASASTFVAGDVGNDVVVTINGVSVKVRITGYTSDTVVTGVPNVDVPTAFQSVAVTTWALAKDVFTGLSHLEGESLSVIGDGLLVANPLRSELTEVVVSSGTITLDEPYSVVHAGLPYVSDFETLDIDPFVGTSIRDKPRWIGRVGLIFEASLATFVGTQLDDEDGDLTGLEELKVRDQDADPEGPPELLTGYKEVNTQGRWDRNGRVVVRHIDPLPLTILAVVPQGHIST